MSKKAIAVGVGIAGVSGGVVFDTHARVRLSFRSDHGRVSEELNSLIRSERFDGGTHITHALLDAAHYLNAKVGPTLAAPS
jgi:hypothetical protein